jgi:hypothetical protein
LSERRARLFRKDQEQAKSRGGIVNSKLRKTAGIVLAGVLLCGTAACTDEDGKTSSGKASGSAQASSSADKPVEVTPAAAVKRAAEKNEKLTSLSYSMSGTVPGGGDIEAQASMTMKPLAMSMKMKGGVGAEAGEVEIRLVGEAMYLNGGEPLEAGKTWMKFDLAALKEAGGEDPLAELTAQADKNPAQDTAALTASKDLKKVGEESVDGVETTHYTGTLTLDAMRASLAGEDAETKKRREGTLEQYEKLGVEKLTMDIWIDENDQTKQVRTRSTTKEGPMDLTIKLLSVNKPVTVTAPPAAETVDLAEMMNDAGSA